MEFNKKEKKKKRNMVGIILFICIFAIVTIIDYGSILEMGVSVATIFLFYLADKFKWFENKNKEKEKEDRDALKKIDTIELKRMKNDYKYWFNLTEKEYNNRKDKSLADKMSEEFMDILGYGLIIFLLGIVMFGAIPSMFGVNNEFVNPTNFTNIDRLGNATNSIETIGNVCEFTLTTVMDIGAHKPTIWFILFWGAVLIGVLIPAIKILVYGFKYFYNKKKEERKHGI